MKRGRHDDVGIVAGLRQSVPQRPCCSYTWGGAPWSLSFYVLQASLPLSRLLSSFFATNVASSSSCRFYSSPSFFRSFFIRFVSFFFLRLAPSIWYAYLVLLVRARVTLLAVALLCSSSFCSATFFFFRGSRSRTCVTGDVIQLVS